MNASGFRPSRKIIFKQLLQIAFVGVIALGLSYLLGAWIGRWIGGVGVGFVRQWVPLYLNLAWIIPSLLLVYPTYRCTFYEIHADAVVIHQGIIMRRIRHIPIKRITGLTVLRGPIDRLFGLGNIQLQTADCQMSGTRFERLQGLQNLREIYDDLTSRIVAA